MDVHLAPLGEEEYFAVVASNLHRRINMILIVPCIAAGIAGIDCSLSLSR